MPLSVGFDLTHARLNRTGLGRYPVELSSALQARSSVRLIGLHAVDEPASSTAGRIVQGLTREGFYYPAGMRRRAAHPSRIVKALASQPLDDPPGRRGGRFVDSVQSDQPHAGARLQRARELDGIATEPGSIEASMREVEANREGHSLRLRARRPTRSCRLDL